MYKKLVSFIIFSFLSLQTFSFFHLAEFGFEEHEHDDEVCEIYLYCEQSKDNISKSEILSQNHEYFTFIIVIFCSTFVLFFYEQEHTKKTINHY